MDKRCVIGAKNKTNGFTIVELLVVIVVIGILAATTIVAYTGIRTKAVAATIRSDLNSASTQLKLFQMENFAYPQTINCALPDSATNKCIKPSGNNAYAYTYNNNSNPQTYTLNETNSSTNSLNFRIATNSATMECPAGFIIVPGSATYNTSDFCAMKYEARQVGATTTPVSQASGLPWTEITQTNAIANSSRVENCTGCHLITEAEWMTIAQNVLSVPSNWNSGVVGTGYIYSGHNDSAPVGAISADSNDSNGYVNETNVGGNQRRTLTLNNGEVIWDLAGDVAEWTQGVASGNQPGVIGNGYNYREFTAITAPGGLAVNIFPSGLGIAGSNTWTTANGVGQLYSSADDGTLNGINRGGHWANTGPAGVLYATMDTTPSFYATFIGFRVTK